MRQRLQKRYPALTDARLLDELIAHSRRARLTRGQPICDIGQQCTHLALVLEGRARVYELGESGREITLYRIGPGECCILTASCIMSHRTFPAIACCEQDLDVLLLPARQVEDFMLRHPQWRRFVWQLLADRLSGVLMLLEEVTFRRLDERLMRHLLAQRALQGSDELQLTHQAIADDLGTSREVVSRLLKDMQQRGMLALSRGHVTLLGDALQQALALCD